MWLPVISPLGRFAMQIACRAVDGPNLQRLLVDPEMDLAPTSRGIAIQCPVGQWTRRLGPPAARQHMLACVRGMLACVPLITRQAHARHTAERASSPSTLMPVLSTAWQGIMQ
jgi:hypothetical protein